MQILRLVHKIFFRISNLSAKYKSNISLKGALSMFLIKRTMDDEDGTHMEGFLTKTGQYGTRKEAFEYSDYNKASEDCKVEDSYFNQAFPNDSNQFQIVEI